MLPLLVVESGLASAEGPAVNSPAREGADRQDPVIRGPKDRHSGCAAPSALMLVTRGFLPRCGRLLLVLGPAVSLSVRPAVSESELFSVRVLGEKRAAEPLSVK